MKRFSIAFILLGLSSFAGACSNEPAQPNEDLGTTSQAITTACNVLTVGLPCDPDGPGKPLLECEGVCAINATGAVACVKAVAGSNDGYICGSQAGIGDSACTRRCSGKS